MICVKMEITWKLGKLKSERVKWQFIGQVRQHNIKKEKKTQKKYFLSWTKCILYALSLTMCGISIVFKSLSPRNIKLLYFPLNLTTVLLFIASINTDFSLQYKTCNTGYKHKHSAQKLYLVLKPARSLRILWLLFFLWFRFSCQFFRSWSCIN